MTISALLTNKINHTPIISPSEQILVKQFHGYLNNIDGKRILVASNSSNTTWTLGTWDYYDMPYTTRWSPEYKKKMIAKMYAVEEYCKKSKKSVVTLLTLTGYQDGNASINAIRKTNTREDLFKVIKHGWNLLSDLLTHECPGLDYVWVVEPHKSGYPHMHVAVLGYIPKELQERLTRLWSEKYQVGSAEHGIDFSVKSVKESVQSIRNYLMKYISKGIGASGCKTWKDEEWVYHAIAWKHQHRYIGMSQTISRYCTAYKLRFKFHKYMTELCNYDIGLLGIPIDKKGIIDAIKQFQWRNPHESTPPPEKRWFCMFLFHSTSGTVRLITKSQSFNTVTGAFDANTATRKPVIRQPIIQQINTTIAEQTAHYYNQFIQTIHTPWNLGLEKSEQTTII